MYVQPLLSPFEDGSFFPSGSNGMGQIETDKILLPSLLLPLLQVAIGDLYVLRPGGVAGPVGVVSVNAKAPSNRLHRKHRQPLFHPIAKIVPRKDVVEICSQSSYPSFSCSWDNRISE